MKKVILLTLLIINNLFAGISTHQEYFSPTEQLIKRESKERIVKKLNGMKIPTEMVDYFDAIAAQEEWGHIGYHGTNQGFRIHQDIIRITLEEIVGFAIPSDFQFLRVPGDPDLNLNTYEEFTHYWGKKVDNKSTTRAKQLISLNFSIYSNFDHEGSCSLNLFVKDKSKNYVYYIDYLKTFYETLGINPEILKELYGVGQSWLNEDGGILLQISENSHLTDPSCFAYNFADTQGFPAKRGGYVYGSYPLSNHYERVLSDLYIDKSIDIAPQLRLIINNRYTLNPYSHLIVKRFDLYPSVTITLYENDLRTRIRSLAFDPEKVEAYKNTLHQMWIER